MRRGIKWFALATTLLCALLGAAAWWAASSPKALQWLVAEAARQSNGTLAFEEVSGSLLGRVQVRRLTYSAKDVRIMLDDVALEMSRRALLHGRLEVVAIDAALGDIHATPSDQPAQPPDSLALPFDIEIQRARIGQLRFKEQSIHNLVFVYRGGKAGHALNELKADTAWGRLTGTLRIAASRPFVLAGQLQLEQSNKWSAQLDLSGDLLATDLAMRGTAHGAAVAARARLAVFKPQWLRELHANGSNFNTAAFLPGFPQSAIEIEVNGASIQSGWPAGSVTIRNAMPGAVNAKLLPLVRLSSNYVLQDLTSVTLTRIAADLGAAGALQGSAELSLAGSRPYQVQARIDRFDPAAFGDYPQATITGRLDISGTLAPQWRANVALTLANSLLRGVKLAGNAAGEITQQGVRNMKVNLTAGANTLHINGSYGRPGDALAVALDAPRLSQLDANMAGALTARGQVMCANLTASMHVSLPFKGVRAGFRRAQLCAARTGWLCKASPGPAGVGMGENAADTCPIPHLTSPLKGEEQDKLALMRGQVNGDAQQPRIALDIAGTGLVWQQNLRIASLRAHAHGTLAQHTATLTAQGQDLDLNARVEGGWKTLHGWSGRLVSLQNNGIYPLRLLTPMPMTYALGRYSAGPAALNVNGGKFSLTSLTWQNGKFETSGKIANLPVAPLLALAGTPAPETTLRIGGAWSVTASPQASGQLNLFRESGDIVTPGETAIALGLERLGIEVRLTNGALDATLKLQASSLSGQAHATATSMSRQGILKLDGRFDIASLRLFDPLIGTQGILRGNAVVNVSAGGTLGAPQLGGSLVADHLAVDAPQHGVRLRNGKLRANLDDKMLTLHEFSIRGDEGTLSATGTMARAADGEARLAWHAEHLLVVNRPGMRLKIDGNGSAALAEKKLVLRGTLTADEGHFEFDTPTAPRLADDIVVIGRPKAVPRSTMGASFRSRLLDIDLVLDAGEHLHIVGAGLNTDLRGKVALKTTPQGVLEARGNLSSRRGVYFAFGQRLDIERGNLIFDGPLDNPALDIAAKRKGLAVEAGVVVTGTLRVPNVQLISDPPVSDSEKLAWLTLGHGLQDATGADLALLQTAAAALVGKGNSVPLTQRIANKLGLDELSLRGGGQAGSQVAALGKHLSDKLYLEYQQGFAAASTVLRLSYALTRSLSLRLETGFTSGLGLYFTRSYD